MARLIKIGVQNRSLDQARNAARHVPGLIRRDVQHQVNEKKVRLMVNRHTVILKTTPESVFGALYTGISLVFTCRLVNNAG